MQTVTYLYSTAPGASTATHHIKSHLCSWDAGFLAKSPPISGPPIQPLLLNRHGKIITPEEERDQALILKDQNS